MDMQSDLKNQYDVLFDVISKKMESQLNSLEMFNTKSSILFAVVGVIFSASLQILSLDKITLKIDAILLLASFASFSISIYCVFDSFVINSFEIWRDDPNPQKLLNLFSSHSEKGEYFLKKEIIANMNESYAHNSELIRAKYNNFIKAKKFLYLGILLLFVHFFIGISCNYNQFGYNFDICSKMKQTISQ